MDLADTVVHEHVYGFLDCGIYNSKIVVCYSQTIHNTGFLIGHRPGQQ